jgi:hypothetical protein
LGCGQVISIASSFEFKWPVNTPCPSFFFFYFFFFLGAILSSATCSNAFQYGSFSIRFCLLIDCVRLLLGFFPFFFSRGFLFPSRALWRRFFRRAAR